MLRAPDCSDVVGLSRLQTDDLICVRVDLGHEGADRGLVRSDGSLGGGDAGEHIGEVRVQHPDHLLELIDERVPAELLRLLPLDLVAGLEGLLRGRRRWSPRRVRRVALLGGVGVVPLAGPGVRRTLLLRRLLGRQPRVLLRLLPLLGGVGRGCGDGRREKSRCDFHTASKQ